jgi:predicted dehydrogenase
MSEYTAAVIGTGPEPDNIVWGESAAMAYRHGNGYRTLDRSDLVACCDIVRENAAAFAAEFDIPEENVFEDHEEMLRTVEPDVVSICTPVPTHADLVLSTLETGVPQAVHCEKPMADTWEDSKRMAARADETGIQLTFNHQRRMGAAWQRADDLLADGRIGDLTRIGVGGKNLFDFGSHLIDLANGYNGERGADWVLSQVHYSEADVRYGTHNENQAVALWEYDNGVHAFAATGKGTGGDATGCLVRLVGTDGTIEVKPDTDGLIRYRSSDTDGWVTESPENDDDKITLALAHVLECLSTGDDPVLSADNALRATEIIFGAWESARKRERIEFPLEYGGNALTEMVESGDLVPE